MEHITILIPRIKPPEVSDIITKQLDIIFLKLQKYFQIELVWVSFQPYEFDEYDIRNYHVIDYHKFNDAVDLIEKIKPDIIICESRLGINGIAFSKAGKSKKIPVITIIGYVGISENFGRTFSIKTSLQLASSNKVLADASKEHKPKKFAMLQYVIDKYVFLLKTLKKSNYTMWDLIKFIFFYPGIHVFGQSYPPLHNITSGNLNFCFNQHLFVRLVEAGFEKSTIMLEGDPVFDELFIRTKKSKSETSSTKINILFCPTPMHEHGWLSKNEEEKMILDIINNIKKNIDFDIALKIHPSTSNYDEYKLLLEKTNYDISLYQKENTVDLLNKYDLMLTYGSSDVILEAVLLHKPVVLFKYSSEDKFNRFSDRNIISECDDLSKLYPIIKNSISHIIPQEQFASYVEQHIGKFDGNNSERIANKIYNFFQKMKA